MQNVNFILNETKHLENFEKIRKYKLKYPNRTLTFLE